MNVQPLDARDDEPHRSDWLLTDQGYLVVHPFQLDATNILHARATDFATRLYLAFPSVHAVYLRGSALESVREELIQDVDMIAVLDVDGLRRHPNIVPSAAALWSQLGYEPRCDIEVMPIDHVVRHPFSTVLQLILAFRAALLAGKPVWEAAPQVRADAALACRLQASHRKGVHRFLEQVKAAPQKLGLDFVASWMQKKALRLGGILAMAVTRRFSRHPLRCARLIAETYPELAELAGAVAHQYLVRQTDASAWRTAHHLFASLSACADRMAEVHVISSGRIVANG